MISLSTASYLVASNFIWKSVQVVGSSMEPTLRNGQHFILNRFTVQYRDPVAGEVVVFRDPSDSHLSVKRVIAEPGDTVELTDGMVLVNEAPITEDYLGDGVRTFGFNAKDVSPLRLDEDHFYLLGDNRGNSADSRTYGSVGREQILGVLMN